MERMRVMTNNPKKIQYKVVDKSGNVVSDETFEDYEKLADHMLDIADKYYQGLYTVDDSVNISTFDESGELIYEDTASFGSNVVTNEEMEDEFRTESKRRNSGQGFGS
jgi:hypothetical protein